MKKTVNKLLKLIQSLSLALLILSVSVLPVFADESLSVSNRYLPMVSTTDDSHIKLTKFQDIEEFSDNFFVNQMTENNIPGAVFTLVKDDKIIFSKGYGYANLEDKIPVIPNKTLFRVGSVSKLVTSTAIMQLVEQGKLKLNEDINQYLKEFQIKTNKFKPITVDHLLTHTHGFDVAWAIGGATLCQSQLPSLEKFLTENLPERVRPPGELYVYSDVGLALAGYLVEVVGGIPFSDYIDQAILQPLNMSQSSFQQPLPSELSANLAVGYQYKNGNYIKQPFTCNKSVPTTALSTTAEDMAHFMIAHLQGGRYGTERILNDTTVKEMHRQHYTNFPNLPQVAGSTYGFFERFVNNQRIIEHGGSMSGYTNLLFLIPEQKLGFYIAYNRNTLNENLRDDLVEQFLDRYYPVHKTISSPTETITKAITEADSTQQYDQQYEQQYKQIKGGYRFIRYPRNSLVKLAMVLLEWGKLLIIQTNKDHTLTIFPGRSTWEEVEPLLFRATDSSMYINFRPDSQGKITGMSMSSHVHLSYEKLPWYEAPVLQLGLAGFSVTIFLWGCLVWLIRPLVSRKNKTLSLVSRHTRLVELSIGLISLLNLCFLMGMGIAISTIDFWEFFFGMPPIIIALLYLPIVTTGLTTIVSIIALLAWRDKNWSWIRRGYYFLSMLAAWLFIWLLNSWNLLGFKF
ncbi:serine hydrolase domain-containing protein [Moorena producens]|uniref:serine hydrolase domain-containing protein n=1 Tax=Moorena producens TaxID=1155739 RepID=UPI003C773CF1